jgi:hypothetical protein
MIRTVEIHTPQEVDAMVEKLRSQLPRLLREQIVRPFCIEDDLRTLAYNTLTDEKWR